ncbi:hypothetical protein ACFL0F_01025 [Patescibacteria group bacterium]
MKYLSNKDKNNKLGNNNSSGQAILLVLLGLAVVLTLVLSVVTRTITDVSLTTRDEESLRAFSAAEAGIEKLLVVGGSLKEGIGDGWIDGAVSEYGAGSAGVNYSALKSGESATVWFVGHDPDGNLSCDDGCFAQSNVDLKVCWGKEGTSDDISETPAVEISVFYDNSAPQAIDSGNYSGVRVARAAIDAHNPPRGDFSHKDLWASNCTIDGVNYEFSIGSSKD